MWHGCPIAVSVSANEAGIFDGPTIAIWRTICFAPMRAKRCLFLAVHILDSCSFILLGQLHLRGSCQESIVERLADQGPDVCVRVFDSR